MSVTEQQVRDVLRTVQDPEIPKNVVDLKMIKTVTVGTGSTDIGVELPTPAYPQRERITERITNAFRTALPSAPAPRVTYTWQVKGKNTGGTIGLRVKNVVAVGSGKGGVGKSTVAASLAYGLHSFGAKVGLMDADIYGPSIPHLFGVKERAQVTELRGANGETVQRLSPIDAQGIKLISIGFLVAEADPVMVRGPILHRTITQFLQMTDWGELDYLIIDMPPGTGDVAITLSQLLGLAGAVVVCTPQQLALLDAVKALNMFRKVNIPVLGMVENMSGEVFGRGGARKKSQELGVPFLGEIPMDTHLRVNGDGGQIAANFAEGCPSRAALLGIAEQTAMQIARSLSEAPAAPMFEIL